MSADRRREHLLSVVKDLYGKAKVKSDLTAELVAEAAGVSAVWVYKRVGDELRELRATLPAGCRPAGDADAEPRSKVELRARLKQLKASYEAVIGGDIAGAIRHIELLDEENRMLRERVRVLEKRLSEYTVVITPTLLPDTEEADEQDAGEEEDQISN